ncbi:hypothetical protein ACG59Z_13990 [Acinetobacter sp. ABJ_C1_1]|uniref:hypothetical protein n=1 Tax=Acinetobacter sp. ABJ_C1_1 TaxID=3378321 RepID=UPI0037DC597F
MYKFNKHLLVVLFFIINMSFFEVKAEESVQNRYKVIGAEQHGSGSVAWIIDTVDDKVILCSHGPSNECSSLIIPNSSSNKPNYLPVGVAKWGNGTAAWIIDTINKDAIICAFGPMHNECTRQKLIQ